MQPTKENSVNIPAFLSKLWRMVNDTNTDNLICWSTSGTSFIILNQVQFWYELLPVYYKHNNMSSFVRQLNMYGFHKISTIDNAGGEGGGDKDEIQFFHPYFQRDKPELLKNIKRKVTGTKAQHHTNENQALYISDDISKVLNDVKQLKGRQTSVDSQLAAMKLENGVLWRELALLRQKHLKQQQIVNKLIQFLVTIVQPTPRMGGLGVKRQYSLMLGDTPNKKTKPSGKSQSVSSDGPIIHELDNENLAAEPANATFETQLPPVSPNPASVSSEVFLDSPEYIEKEMIELLSDNENHDDGKTLTGEDTSQVFLNPNTQDVMLSNLMNGSYNTTALKDITGNGGKVTAEHLDEESEALNDDSMALAKPESTHPPKYTRLNSVEDLDFHVETTQNELDQLKELLNNCSTFDANTLLGLFNEGAPNYGLSYAADEGKDPLLSGSELATYGSGLDFNQIMDETSQETQNVKQEQPAISGGKQLSGLDFSQLFDDSSEEALQTELLNDMAAGTSSVDAAGSITTPQIESDEPKFPTVIKQE